MKKLKEPEYKKHIISEKVELFKRTLLLFTSLFLLLILYVSQSEFRNNGLYLLLLINIVGVYISFLLAQKQIKVQSDYTDKICSLFKQGDCNNILESDASKLFGILSWTEIGLGYFIANVLILMFFPHLIIYLLIINILALPYTLWSVWYQKYKAKQWCMLCLIVQGLLWAIFIVNLTSENIFIPEFSIKEIITVGCLYLIPILTANILLPILSKSKNFEQVTHEINSIKATEAVFLSVSKKQPYYKVDKNTSQIIFGNLNAKILITVLTNPHCNPCAELHKRISQLVTENINLCIQYIFCSFENSLDSSNQFLIYVYLNKPDERNKIFDCWFEYGKNKKEQFFKLHNFTTTEQTLMEFEKHNEWEQETNLSSTPTILVNGYKLPDNYSIENLKYFEDLDIDAK